MPRILSIAVFVAFVLSGCGDNAPPLPTSTEAGQVLKSHIDRTFRYALAKEITITDPGGRDVPCGDGKYRRTYSVEAVAGEGPGDSQKVATSLISALNGVAKYQMTEVPGTLAMRVAVSTQFRTRIAIYSPSKGRMAARGETECLALKSDSAV
ncbi:hypothetical protein [Acrocarpospora corrugata]|uniref:hypothetical protein n=1 Tax=Acrocarpospora corrugata TaxID=35763 RepID=UPI0012D3637C|nr:hypothetical protein [Acrocarpospora corrugata]